MDRLQEALTLALKLSPKERIQLIERVASSVEQEFGTSGPGEIESTGHWGQSLVRLIQSLDMGDWEAVDMDDSVNWVQSLRQESEDRLKPYWDGEK
jgi:hypothetical protein